jgi:dCMP deaminase
LRPEWDTYFLTIARVVATRSTCDRANVGAVLVKEKRILTTGFNGSPAGLDHCDDVGHLMVDGHCQRTIHAEANAIIQAALHGVSTNGSTCYVTHFPCISCTKMLINAGVSRIVFADEYGDTSHSRMFLSQAGVEVYRGEANRALFDE